MGAKRACETQSGARVRPCSLRRRLRVSRSRPTRSTPSSPTGNTNNNTPSRDAGIDSKDGFEDRDELMEACDRVCSANRAARDAAISSLSAYFRLRFDEEDVVRYESTITNALFNCIRKGKCEERCRAATALALMAWSLGGADDVFDKARRYAEKVRAEVRSRLDETCSSRHGPSSRLTDASRHRCAGAHDRDQKGRRLQRVCRCDRDDLFRRVAKFV